MDPTDPLAATGRHREPQGSTQTSNATNSTHATKGHKKTQEMTEKAVEMTQGAGDKKEATFSEHVDID